MQAEREPRLGLVAARPFVQLHQRMHIPAPKS
jgi:hypothetical protein